MADRLVGSNYITPDIVAKVTGRARYAEDFRAEGMLFCKLMLSPRPHARVRSIDTSRAMRLARRPRDPHAGRRAGARRHHRTLPDQRAAVRRRADSRGGGDQRGDRRRSDRADSSSISNRCPTSSIRSKACGPAVRMRAPKATSGDPPRRAQPPRPTIQELKWTEADFADADRRPHADGQGDRGMVVRRSRRRHSRTPRSWSTNRSSCRPPAIIRWKRAARWRSGRTASCICTARHRASSARSMRVARWVGIEPKDVVLICEYTGGGFGSKGGGAVSMAIPALLSKKANAPVMMRISREEESYIGRARTNMAGPRARSASRRTAGSSRSISSSSRTTARTGRWAITDRRATRRR